MDKDTVDIITSLNAEQNKYFEKLLANQCDNSDLKIKGVQKSIEAGLETVALELSKRNGIIKEMKETLCEVENHTSWWRFFQRNPKVSVIMFILVIVGAIALFGFKVPYGKGTEQIGVSVFQYLFESIF